MVVRDSRFEPLHRLKAVSDSGQESAHPNPILPRVPGHMYDPAVQTALLAALARFRRLPQGDLLGMLSPVDRLRYRPEALRDLEWEGLISVTPSGDEPVVALTAAGEAWLRGQGVSHG